MTTVRWILWLVVGGVVLYLLERFFGGEDPGLVTSDQLMDPGSQVGTRGTGAATRGAREATWRQQFTNLDPVSPLGSPADTTVGQWFERAATNTATIPYEPAAGYVNVGDTCSPSGSTATALINGQNEVVHCKRTGLSSVDRWYWYG